MAVVSSNVAELAFVGRRFPMEQSHRFPVLSLLPS